MGFSEKAIAYVVRPRSTLICFEINDDFPLEKLLQRAILGFKAIAKHSNQLSVVFRRGGDRVQF
ncbi:MAG: hypothetical protein AAGD25_16610 [Cyanobacteria bacterium P01_F01_bin.150]